MIDVLRSVAEPYTSKLPEGIAPVTTISFTGSFAANLLIGAVFSSTPASIVPLAFAGATFATVASLVDSAIRPLIGSFNIGHVDDHESLFDWAGRQVVVLGLTAYALPFGLPLVGIQAPAQLVNRLVFSSAGFNFFIQFVLSRLLNLNDNHARVHGAFSLI